LNFKKHKNKPPKIQKEGENLAQIEVFSPFPTAFHLVSGIGGAYISRIVSTRSEVGVTARQDQCGEARAAVVSPLLLYFGEPAPPLATVLQVIIGRGNVRGFPNGIAQLPIKPLIRGGYRLRGLMLECFPLRMVLLYHVFFFVCGKVENIFKRISNRGEKSLSKSSFTISRKTKREISLRTSLFVAFLPRLCRYLA
jgi:hypothetical protein